MDNGTDGAFTALFRVYMAFDYFFAHVSVTFVCAHFQLEYFFMRVLTQNKIDSAKQLHLLKHGWCVVDGALGADMASKLLSEMQVLEKANLFLPNKVQFTVQSNGQSVLTRTRTRTPNSQPNPDLNTNPNSDP